LTDTISARDITAISKSDVPDRLDREWEDNVPKHALWCPLSRPSGEVFGGLLITREQLFTDIEMSLLQPLMEACGHAWNALDAGGGGRHGRALHALTRRPVRIAALLLLGIVLALPIRESVLAPAEIVAVDPFVVSAPTSGVIKQFHVRPNDTVEPSQALFSLDDTELRTEHEISAMTLATAEADYLRAAQKSFNDEQSKSELELYRARVEEAALKMDHSKALLERTQVRARRQGIVIFGDENDWIGQPVSVGQRILTIADPASIEIQISLPVEDAINLEPGSEVRMFLNADPTSPLYASIRQTSYEPVKTASGNMAFRIKASMTSPGNYPRIGLRGTAKIYGESVSVLYFLTRRPLSALRQTLGF
jgi:multidrug resistance efflux pump